jgi:hypothetical protein
MDGIKVKVNLWTFVTCLVVWIGLAALMAIPGYTLPGELKNLFATLTGVILVIIHGFEKDISLSNGAQPDKPGNSTAP